MKTLNTNDLIVARDEDNDSTITGRITVIDGSLIYVLVEGEELVIDIDQITENLGAEVSA